MAAIVTVAESAGAAPSRPTFVRRVTFDGNGTYAAGGIAFSLGAGFEGENILAIIPQPAEGNANAKAAEYDYATDKLKLLDGNLAELGAVDVTGEVVTLVVVTQ